MTGRLMYRRNMWLSLAAAMSLLVGCDRYSGFGSSCSEGNPAVARARSLSQTELAFLYAEIFRLREENNQSSIEYGAFGKKIPDNLRFLDAARIRPSGDPPNIMLAGCMDEFIDLRFSSPDEKDPGIQLSWAAGPYKTESEMLWKAEK